MRHHARASSYPLPYYPTDNVIKGRPALYVPDDKLPLAFICDIDGTVALKGARDPYDETTVHLDRPNPAVIEIVKNHVALGYQAIFLSGRTMKCYGETHKWLRTEHCVHEREPGVVNDYGFREKMFMLRMRAEGDSRKDSIVKRELFDAWVT